MNPGIERAAHWLAEQHRVRAPFAAFASRVAPRSVDEAYAVQEAFVARKARVCGPCCGWKIALSNPAMQAMVGLPEPVAGRLFTRQVVGAPGRVRAGDYGRLLVEFEIAVELGADLPAGALPHTRQSVMPAVLAVRPAFELVDDRGADYSTLRQHALQLVADNAWSEGAVLGALRRDWRLLDLATLRGTASIDGELAGQGRGSDLMGHPLEALAWIANHANRRGDMLRAGEWAILGSLVTSKFPKPGQVLRFKLDGFPAIELQVD
jgi:2-keto-4-pentenoate hydratase